LGLLPPTLIDAIPFAKGGQLDEDLVLRLIQRKGLDRVHAGLLIANLGRHGAAQRLGLPSLEGVVGPFVYSDTHEKYLGVTTVGGEMRFALSYGPAIVERRTVERVRDRAMALLGEAAPS
jgi:hypothetical protein